MPVATALQKISSQSLAQKAQASIRQAILEGSIGAGEWPTIEKLADDLGISRTPVREALKALEADGLVEILPNRGIHIRRFDKQELSNRYALRALLEGRAGEMACTADAPALIDTLEQNYEAMRGRIAALGQDAEDAAFVPLITLNGEFHRALVQAAGDVMLGKFLDMLQTPLVHRFYHWRDPARQQAVLDEHRQIIDALRARESEQVKRLLEAHVLEARTYLLEHLQQSIA